MAIEFKTPAHEEIYQVVEDYLVALDVHYVKSDDHAYFTLPFPEGVDLHVMVRSWGDDDALIVIRAWLVRPSQLSQDLLRYLLERNYSSRIGALALDADGDILIQHALGGSDLDRNELHDATYAVEFAGARARDRILKRYEGRAL